MRYLQLSDIGIIDRDGWVNQHQKASWFTTRKEAEQAWKDSVEASSYPAEVVEFWCLSSQ